MSYYLKYIGVYWLPFSTYKKHSNGSINSFLKSLILWFIPLISKNIENPLLQLWRIYEWLTGTIVSSSPWMNNSGVYISSNLTILFNSFFTTMETIFPNQSIIKFFSEAKGDIKIHEWTKK